MLVISKCTTLRALPFPVPSHTGSGSVFPKKKPVILSCVTSCPAWLGWLEGQRGVSSPYCFILRLILSCLPFPQHTFSLADHFHDPFWPSGGKGFFPPYPPFPTMAKACPWHSHKMTPTCSCRNTELLVLTETSGFLFALYTLLLVNTNASVCLIPLNI